jgi:hypothetical protein
VSEDADVKERWRSSGVDLGFKARRVDLAITSALGWKVGERVPLRTRGGGFAGEAALGVVLALAATRLLLEEVEYFA